MRSDEEAHAAEALARSSFLRDLHAASLYLLLAIIAMFLVTTGHRVLDGR